MTKSASSLTSPIFQEGDSFYVQRDVEGKARAALEIYKDVAEAQPKNADALWRYAMACHFVGMRYEKDSDLKKSLFDVGRKVGKKSTELSPECGACHFWTGINMALYAQEVGILKMLFTVSEVESHLKKAAAIDPSYAFGGPYRVLGIIQKNLPGLLGGSDRLAVEYLEKAIHAAPHSALNYLVLSEIYRDSYHDFQKAIQWAEAGARLQSLVDPPVEERESKQEIIQLIPRLRELNETLTKPKRRVSEVSR